MAKTKTHFDFSPSVCHRRVMDETTPSLRYDGGDVVRWQRKLRAKLRELLGWPAGPRAPLRVRSQWVREHPLGRIEKIVFSSERAADIPAYVCLPKSAKPPYSFFICLQGHSTGMHNSIAVDRETESTPIKTEGDRDFALGCMERGIAALCIEQRSFGERGEKVQKMVAPHGYCHDATMQAFMLGRTLVGERAFDVDRGIDYLLSRGDADPKRIGSMGNSGGGTTTVYAAAMLPRLGFAMPSCSFCTYRDAKMSLYHCACGYIPGILKYAEMADVLGLFAPRPVVVVAGRRDPIMPIAGVRRAFSHLKRIYRAAGAEERCHLVIGPEGHRFYAAKAWPAMLKEMGGRERP